MQATYRVAITSPARHDLRAIARYIAQDNPARARTFATELLGQVEALSAFPPRGRAGRVSGTRELVAHPNYVAIYRVDDKARSVEVLRVLHAAKMWP